MGGFSPGARYFFVDREHDDDWWRSGDEPWQLRGGVIATIDSQELVAGTTFNLNSTPMTLETLRVAAPSKCSTVGRFPQVGIETRLGGNALRWRDHLLYQTLVDGERWNGARSACLMTSERWLGRSWAGVGQDILFVPCSREDSASASPRLWPALQPGPHKVKMRAFLPGTDIVLETETLTVDLRCPGPVEE